MKIFNPTHEATKDAEAISEILKLGLESKTEMEKNIALQQGIRYVAMYAAKGGSAFEAVDGLQQALRRIRAITTNALPRNIDGRGDEIQAIEGEVSDADPPGK